MCGCHLLPKRNRIKGIVLDCTSQWTHTITPRAHNLQAGCVFVSPAAEIANDDWEMLISHRLWPANWLLCDRCADACLSEWKESDDPRRKRSIIARDAGKPDRTNPRVGKGIHVLRINWRVIPINWHWNHYLWAGYQSHKCISLIRGLVARPCSRECCGVLTNLEPNPAFLCFPWLHHIFVRGSSQKKL